MSQYSLDALTNHLAELRDDHARWAKEFGDRDDAGRAAAYRMALSLLHIYTNGDYGQPTTSAVTEVAR